MRIEKERKKEMEKKKVKLSERVVKALEEQGFNVFDGEAEFQDHAGEYFCEVETSSPAGEDLVPGIWFDGTEKGFVEGFRIMAEGLVEGFDSDENVELWVGMRGEGGVPETVRELVEGAEAIKKIYLDAAEALEIATELKDADETARKDRISDVDRLFCSMAETLSKHADGMKEDGLWSDGDEIYAWDAETAEGIADLFDAMYGQGSCVTGYYAPDEDARNNEEDERTGWHYVSVS